jgi:glycosyltransferase involved in cell wall biosynthesis
MPEKPKKIIVICHNYEPANTPKDPDADDRYYTYGFGGTMGKSLKKYIPEFEIEVWRLDGYIKKYNEKEISGVKYRVFPSIHKANIIDFSFRFLRELKKEVKKNDPVLIVIHTNYWVAYQVLFFFSNSKIITTHHGDWSPFYRVNNTSGLRKLKARLDMFIEKRVFKHIDMIFTTELKQIQYFRMANPDIKYTLWTMGVNVDNMQVISREAARKDLGWDPMKKYILYVGKLYKYKQADDMINDWLEIKAKRPEVELVIIGNTPNDPWEEFHDMAEKSGAMLLGRVLNKDLYKYYSAADVYVLYSVRDDFFGGTGIAPLESIACGTPVVSNAMRNYIGDNINEIAEVPDTLEAHKDAILKVLDNPQNYKNMRESILKYYSFEAGFIRTKNILEDLFASRKKIN